MSRRGGGSDRRFSGARILIALAIAAFSVLSYCSSRDYNEITEETQYVGLSEEQEIALGLQAAPKMAEQHGGLDADERDQAFLDQICTRLINDTLADQADWPYECHLLADREVVNAFALPGGQMFMTRALYDRLTTEGQVAGVMAHEIGHVLARHGAQQMAKAELTQGLSGAAVIAAYDPDDPNTQQTAQVAAMIGQLVNMKYGRDDELESDQLGVRLMAEAEYDPRSLIEVMRVLDEASSGARPPEFFSTHPNPDNRIEQIREAIAAQFPDGVPEGYTE